MIRISRPSRGLPAWHARFLAMLPAIRTHARFAFRHLNPEAREEHLQRLAEAGIDSTVHSHLIAFAAEEARLTGRVVDLATA